MVLGYHQLTNMPRSAQNIEQLFFDVLKNRLETYLYVWHLAPNRPTKIRQTVQRKSAKLSKRFLIIWLFEK